MSQRARSVRQLGSILRRCGLAPRFAGGKWNARQERRNRAWIGLEALEQRLQLSGGPTLTTITTQVGATEHSAYTITYANLLTASNAADTNSQPIQFRIDSVASSGTLTENGTAVTPGTTLLATGQSLVWTPNASGQINAFTVDAFDGTSHSTPAEPVKIAVAPGEVGYNEAYYLANNLDVKAAVIAGQFTSGEQHFDEYGRAEGRVPSEQAIGFNEQWYLDEYPAVATLVHNGTYYSGLEYYLEVGKGEGELPGPLAVGYNESFYLETYPDVAAAVRAGTYLSGYEHYVLYGHLENREAGPLAVGFSEPFYLETYPDVATAVKDGLFISGFEHYVLYGQNENRLPGPLAVGFDDSFYLETNPDVATAVRNGAFISGYEHYVLYGDTEGRLPGPLAVGFDETYYLDNNSDVAAAVNAGNFVSGFEHYVLYGHTEGRLPGPLAVGFDESYYLTEYPDVAAAVNAGDFISGFEHYVLYGMNEGRFPHAQTPTVTGSTTSASETPPNPGTTLASQVVPNLTINDTDTSDLTSATIEMTDSLTGDSITLGNGYSVQNGNEVYNASSQNTGLTVTVNSDYSLTLNGTAAFSTYEDALDSIVFYTTNGDSSATRHVSVVVTSSVGGVSSADVFAVNFTQAPPVVTGNTAAKVLANPNDTTIAAQLITNLTVADPNDTVLTSATVTLSGDSGDFMSLDETQYTLNGMDEVINSNSVDTGVALSGNGSGTLSFTGGASTATYQGILSAIEFFTTSGDTTTLRHVSVTVTDALSLTSTADDFSFDFPVQTPVVSGSNASATVTSPDPSTTLAAQLQPNLSILDLDSPNMTGATVTYADPISGDTLSIVGYTITDSEIGSTGITLSGNNTTDMTFSGTASQSTYEQVLNSVVFYTTSQETADSREVAVTVTDANSITSGIDYLTVLFAAVAPSVTGGTTPATVPSPAEGSITAAQVVPDLTIADPSTSTITGATISITNAQTGDAMSLTDGYTINESNQVVAPDSSLTGITVESSTSSGNFTLTFSGSASLDTYQDVLNSQIFITTSTDYADTRDLSVTVTDANSLTSTADTFAFTFPAAPTVTGSTTPTEVDSPDAGVVTSAQVLPNLTITDSTTDTYYTASVAITNAQTGDTMTLGNGYSVDGDNNVLAPGSQSTGLVLTGNNTTSFSITGFVAAATYEEVLNSIVFYTTSTDVTDTRDVSVTVTDANAQLSAADTFDVSFPATPTITGSTTPASVTVADGSNYAVQALPNLTVSSSPDITLVSVTMTTQVGGDYILLDSNLFTVGDGNVITGTNITISGNGTAATITLSGKDTAAHYQEVLNALTFQTTSADASTTRTVSITLTNVAGQVSTADAFNVNYDVAPTVDLTGNFDISGYDFSYNPDYAPYYYDASVGITYNSGTNLTGAAVTSLDTSGDHVTGALMLLDSSDFTVSDGEIYDSSDTDTGVSVTGYGTDTMSFSGSASTATYAAILSAIRFFNSSYSNPWYLTLNFTVTVTDQAGLSSTPQSVDIYNDSP